MISRLTINEYQCREYTFFVQGDSKYKTHLRLGCLAQKTNINVFVSLKLQQCCNFSIRSKRQERVLNCSGG